MDQTERLLTGLKAGLYDMVFCSYQPGENGLRFTPVVELPFVVAMLKDDPLAKCPSITPDQLAGRPMVFTDSPAYSDLLRRMLGEYGIRPEIRGYSNEDSVLLSMVQAGLGVFISTDHPQMYSPDTVLVPLRQDRYRRYVYMVIRPVLRPAPPPPSSSTTTSSAPCRNRAASPAPMAGINNKAKRNAARPVQTDRAAFCSKKERERPLQKYILIA